MFKDPEPTSRLACIDRINQDIQRIRAIADAISEDMESPADETIPTLGATIYDLAGRVHDDANTLNKICMGKLKEVSHD